MTRALLWKELREQRPLVLAAWLIALVLPVFLIAGMAAATPRYEISALGSMLGMIVVFVVWPVFAAAAGATTVAAERTDGSLRFLLSRPISRNRIWGAKLIAALASLALVVTGSLLIVTAFDSWLSGRLRWLGGELSLRVDADLGAFLVIVAALFVAAHYCSLFFRRPLAAALAGIVIAGAMAACVTAAWSLLVPVGNIYGAFFVDSANDAALPLAVALLLVAAWWRFTRGDLFGGHEARRMAVPLLAITGGVALVAAVPGVYLASSAMARMSAGLPPGAWLDGGIVGVTRAAGPFGTHVVLVDTTTGDAAPIGARGGVAPALSPDGSLVAYMRLPGFFDGGDAEVRVVRRDGTGDRSVAQGVSPTWGPALAISPDNRYVVLHGRRGFVLVASLADAAAAPRTIELDREIDVWVTDPLGWTAAGSELLFTRRSSSRDIDARTEIMALDLATGTERVVTTFAGRHWFGVRPGPGRIAVDRVWAWYPVWIEDDDAGVTRLLVIDTITGARIELSDRPCEQWGFAGASRFVYGHCEDRGSVDDMELRVRDLSTGADEPLAFVDDVRRVRAVSELYLSPDGTRLAAMLWPGRRRFATYLIERAASAGAADDAPADTVATATTASPPARLEIIGAPGPYHYPLGWLDEDHVVLVTLGRDGSVTLEVINVDTGAARQAYSQ